MKLLKEELFEPIFRYLRFKAALPYFKRSKPITLLDLGCGRQISFYYFARKKGITFREYIGIDPLLSEDILRKNKNKKPIKLIKKSLKNKLPLKNNQVDYVVGFAFLEHIDNPDKILAESIRVLKNKGRAIFTTPTPKAKGVLEFLAKMNLVSKREIEEHKNYFSKDKLLKFAGEKNVKTTFSYFEFGFNSLLIIKKDSTK